MFSGVTDTQQQRIIPHRLQRKKIDQGQDHLVQGGIVPAQSETVFLAHVIRTLVIRHILLYKVPQIFRQANNQPIEHQN